MSKFTCHNCGTGNAPESLFCSKCATSLRRDQLKRQRHLRVLTPPQDSIDHPNFSPASPPAPTFNSAGALMIGMIVVVAIIIWWVYLNG